MTIEILYIVLALIFGILGYFHYIIDKQRREMDSMWMQIAILAGSVAEKLIELKENNKDKNGKE